MTTPSHTTDQLIASARADIDGIVLTLRRHLAHGDDEVEVIAESMVGLLKCSHRSTVAIAVLALVDLAKRPVEVSA